MIAAPAPCTGPAPDVLASIEEIIEDARNGRMFILVDDEDRENEGDLVIPAQMATPDAINFMATHGRGLICLCLARDRADQLGLRPMTERNGTVHQTAFTVSIEARDGVTTGISAADRARTIAVAIDSGRSAEHIVTPGHVFPLVAREGGVLVRAGHTEAAVDVARLAGLNESGVICEIMNEDGTMARRDDLIAFARRHRLKLGTISDLIAYRRRHDRLVERVAEASLLSEHGGQWTAITYRNRIDGSCSTALCKGEPAPGQPTLVRVHGVSVMDDMLGRSGARKRLLQRAMVEIARSGAGVIVLLGMDLERGAAGEELALRDYGIGAQILSDLGVGDMILLSHSRHLMVALGGHGLNIVAERPIPDERALDPVPVRTAA